MIVTGRMKWFDPVKGYGFVVPDPGSPVDRDVMIHASVVERCDERCYLVKDALVECDASPSGSGWRADHLLSVTVPEVLAARADARQLRSIIRAVVGCCEADPAVRRGLSCMIGELRAAAEGR